jgi:hypothetical protein
MRRCSSRALVAVVLLFGCTTSRSELAAPSDGDAAADDAPKGDATQSAGGEAAGEPDEAACCGVDSGRFAGDGGASDAEEQSVVEVCSPPGAAIHDCCVGCAFIIVCGYLYGPADVNSGVEAECLTCPATIAAQRTVGCGDASCMWAGCDAALE